MSKKSEQFQHKLTKPEAADLAYWNKVLAKEGLSENAGNTHHQLVYVEDTDIFQSRKTKVGNGGGRLRKYALGNRQSLTLDCRQCKRSFTAKRGDATFCSDACRKGLTRKPKMPIGPRFCKKCGRMFKANKQHSRFCSYKCRKRAWIEPSRKPRLCEFCETSLKGKRQGAKFCSAKCRLKVKRMMERKDVRDNQPKRWED